MADDDFVVIGGGFAGLAAAARLVRRGRDVVLVEASHQLGGRVRQVRLEDGDLAELGAEFLHGGDAPAKRLADELRLPTQQVFTTAHGDGGPDDSPAPDGGVGLYHVNGQLLPHDSTDQGFVSLGAALDGLRSDGAPQPTDSRDLAQYLRDEGVPERMLDLARASYSNTLGVGGALHELPVGRVAALEAEWGSDGDGDYRMGAAGGDAPAHSLADCAAAMARGVRVLKDWAAAHVDAAAAIGDGGVGATRRAEVVVTSTLGEQLRASRVIVAVPLPLLQRAELGFSPPLPADKTRALRSIRMLAACKILLHFAPSTAEPPWGPTRAAGQPLHSIICSSHAVPELWFRTTRGGGWLVSGFATGDFAVRLAALGESEAVELLLRQLEDVLPGVQPGACAASLRSRLRWSALHDWAADRWVGGGYSAPSFGELEGARRLYRRPEFGGRVCFCGEASEEACMTMSSALASGRRAADEAVEAAAAPARAGPRGEPAVASRL